MTPRSNAERLYGPMLEKTFPNVLTHWLTQEFPHLGGPKVRALFVTEVMDLIETYYVPQDRLQPGQIVWYAVDKTDLPRDGKSMAHTRLVPVILTLVDREDIQALLQKVPLKQVRQQVIARLLREAEAQGGVLAQTDVGLLLSQHRSTVGNAIRAYEAEHQCTLPSRGTVHDLGRAVSHKGLIAKKAFLEAKQAPDVAWETDHSLTSTERYLLDLMRVYTSLKRHDMSIEQTAFATGMSLSLVKEYAALIDELDLNDDQLSGIIAQLQHTAQARQRDISSDSLSRDSVPDPPRQG